ncbi:MAG: thiolase family protein, partial [Ktedonobacterales bacterium]
MPEAVIVSAVRTPIGRAGKGALKTVRADDLAAVAVRGAVERLPTFDLSLIEDVVVGCAFPEGEQGMNVARIITGLAGLPTTAGAMTVNRFCASSLTAFNIAAQAIQLGNGDVAVVGGVEAMSRVPMGGFNPSFNPRLAGGTEGIELCGLSEQRTSEFLQAYIPMGHTAENLAKQYNISRADQDAFALRSHQRALNAGDTGVFAKEIVPVPLPDGSM